MFICPISYIFTAFALCYNTVSGEVVKELKNYGNTRIDHVSYRIVNGNDADIKDYPFAALIFFTPASKLIGGATIIAPLWTVTAADIGTTIEKGNIPLNLFTIRSNSSYQDELYSEHSIAKIIIHKAFSMESHDYNIAMIKVNNPFNGRYEKPIALAEKDYKYTPNTTVYVIGWGRTEKGELSKVLKYGRVTIVDSYSCRSYWRLNETTITYRMVCAFGAGTDPCTGDVGSALLQSDKLIGIALFWRTPCGDLVFPTVYTKVSEFHSWILETMQTD
ncbi:hypothetical protein ILUMI_04365 [Ignelater luminosus]|uniref:Peptidase S1 domain-containing protein n=1 Tax=Ignelater luminosus TaxID=2038154 RepID=A0A8K0DEH3_IGNLU|nr:hypothetical protein ILUMI_04365 [Ignelater luminosus]